MTRSSYLALGIVTRGLLAVDPIGGASRAVRGYIGEYPESVVPVEPGDSDSDSPLSSGAFDSNGIPRMLDDDIISLAFTDVSRSVFWNPDREYTGYGADGYYYINGVRDLTNRATWSEEADSGPTLWRGTAAGFPKRIITAANRFEVVLLDADTLDVWLRFEIGTTAPPGPKGKMIGHASTVVRDVVFVEGRLLVATNEGLRVASFAEDRGFLIGITGNQYASAVGPATGGLRYRNDDTFLDATSESDAAKSLNSDDCLCVDARLYALGKDFDDQGIRGSMVVAVVGHPNGLTAVSFKIPAVDGHRAIKHANARTFGAGWEAEDDGGGDGSTEYFADDNYAATNWAALGVRPGDTLSTDLPSTHTIIAVEQLANGRRLRLDPALADGATGASYSIQRAISSVHLDFGMVLYVSDGPNAVASNGSLDWFEAVPAVAKLQLYGGSNLVWRGGLSRTAAVATRANALVKSGDTLFLGTDIGVFRATVADLDGSRLARFVYSTAAYTGAEAEFKILAGHESDTEVVDLAVDPETGNLVVAVTDTGSIVTEINPNVERAFRFFDDVGRVRRLLTYRNPLGPPDVAVS